MKRNGINASIAHWQGIHVAVANLTVFGIEAIEIGSGNPKHGMTRIDAKAFGDMAGGKLQNTSGTGADIEQAIRSFIGEKAGQDLIDLIRIDRKIALIVPALCSRAKELSGFLTSGIADLPQSLTILGKDRIGFGQQAAKASSHSAAAAALGSSIKNPASLAEPLEQTGFCEQF